MQASPLTKGGLRGVYASVQNPLRLPLRKGERKNPRFLPISQSIPVRIIEIPVGFVRVRATSSFFQVREPIRPGLKGRNDKAHGQRAKVRLRDHARMDSHCDSVVQDVDFSPSTDGVDVARHQQGVGLEAHARDVVVPGCRLHYIVADVNIGKVRAAQG